MVLKILAIVYDNRRKIRGSCVLFTLLFVLLLFLAISDFRQNRLPNAALLLLFIIGIAWAFENGKLDEALLAAALGFIIFYLIKVLFQHFRGKNGLGMGDVKLFGVAGLWVGITGLFWVLLVGSLGTLIYTSIRHFIYKDITSDTKLPFGAFLCFGIGAFYLASAL